MPSKLDNPINWSFFVGRLFRIDIRVHLLFVLGGLVLVANSVRDGGGWMGCVYGVGQMAMLFFIVLVHEFGHCFGARFSGGEADEILLWPLGGLAFTNPPHTPRAHLITVVAGPLVNVIFLILTAAVLIAWTGTAGSVPFNPFTPFETRLPVASEVQYWLVVFFTLNYIILLFNLAPVFPFDGGRILQCVLWFRKGFRPATEMATGIGMVGAVVIGVIGIFSQQMMFFAIAFFGYFTCWQQRQMLKAGVYDATNEFGYDFSGGYTSLDGKNETREAKPSFLQRWRARREMARAQKEADRREELRREVDRILEKVHHSGLESLSPKERRILEQATDHQRANR